VLREPHRNRAPAARHRRRRLAPPRSASESVAPVKFARLRLVEDAKSATFPLRDNVRFHDGSAVLADDVKWSYEQYRGAWAKVLHDLTARIEIVDPRTVRFDFREPFLDFPRLIGTANVCGAGWVVPAKY